MYIGHGVKLMKQIVASELYQSIRFLVLTANKTFMITPANKAFGGVHRNHPAHPSICQSICLIITTSPQRMIRY